MDKANRLLDLLQSNEIKICIIGLGYVGLPLAVEFGKKFKTIGFDINIQRLEELKDGYDQTLEITSDEIKLSNHLSLTSNIDDIRNADVYIVTVPTPISDDKKPNLEPIFSASKLVGKVISDGNVVIYESTVYPGATEEDCIPLIEKESNFIFNQNFYAGYSPERINPGDKEHTLTNITKITSGSTPSISVFVDELYKSIILAGTYRAPSIRVAEAAKVIENTQRDVNIGLINELSIIFNRLNIDTEEVLKAAGTKWNFLNFRPGLVGGHCIGVDPYYLTYKADKVGLKPEVILAGRKTNDSMSKTIVKRFLEQFENKNIKLTNSRVLIMGLTFKENCPDIRNSKVFDVIDELHKSKINVDVYDPWIKDKNIINRDIRFIETPKTNEYDGIIISVAHEQFKELGINQIRSFGKEKNIIFDLKYIFDSDYTDLRL